MLKDSNTLIGKYQYTTKEIDDEQNFYKSPATYIFEYKIVEDLNTVTIASNSVLEKYNLINDKEIKYDTEYSNDVIRKKTNFDIINKPVVLYSQNEQIASGIIQSDENINTKSHITITINEKSYKLSSTIEAMDESVFTYFDSLKFIKSEAMLKNYSIGMQADAQAKVDAKLKADEIGMHVPQHMIDSDFDNLKELDKNIGFIKVKMLFYSDIELKNKTKLDETHKTKSFNNPPTPIYVNKNEWKKYIESVSMQVPQNEIYSNFDDLQEFDITFYSDINLKHKTKLDNRHISTTTNYGDSADGIPIYVNKNEWKKYLQKKKDDEVKQKKDDEVKQKNKELFNNLPKSEKDLINEFEKQINSDDTKALKTPPELVEIVSKIVNNNNNTKALNYLKTTNENFKQAYNDHTEGKKTFNLVTDRIQSMCMQLVMLYHH